MSPQTYSPDFQRFLQLVDTCLAQAAIDARELAERTGTPLVVRYRSESASETDAASKENEHINNGTIC